MQISSLALAAARMPANARSNAPAAKTVGYAAIGLGNISDVFMKSMEETTNSRVTALVTGHPIDKGRKYAAMYGIPESSIYTYETFDRIRDNKAVDAVYVGLPNSMHCDFTVRAAQAGKHVFCEKPMAISSAECRQMIEACRKADRKLMIGYRVQQDPTWMKVAEMLQAGRIGRIRSMQGGMYSDMTPNQWRLTRKFAGGGSLMDIGIYPLNGIRFLAREEPAAFTAQVSTIDRSSGRFAEMEESVEWTMKFPSGLVAACGSSYGSRGPGALRVLGDKGWLDLNPAFGNGAHVTGQISDASGNTSIDIPPAGSKPHFQFPLEASHFSDCILNDRLPKSPGEEGLSDMIAIEAIYKAAGTPIA